MVDGENSYFVNYDDPVAAKIKLTDIAHQITNQQYPPQLKALGKTFRESNFALEFHENVLQPAFEARTHRDRHHNRCLCFVETMLVRPLALILWILLWFIMRVASRCIYCFSKNPSFVILDQLGGSIESPKQKSKLGGLRQASEDDLTTMKGLYRAAHLRKGIDLKQKKNR